MDSSLLATKLRIPPPATHVVHRSRLVRALERGIAERKLVLVSAPAGYGKTTLLADWARHSRLPVAWVSLGEEENDPERLFRYLLAAWQDVQPEVGESPLGLLLGASSPDHDAVLAALLNVANRLSGHLAIIFDDYHLIHEPAIHTAMAFLLDHLPPALHLVLAGRGEPPLPLARYRARHELLELGTEDLQFQLDETGQLLHRLLGAGLDPDSLIAPLHAELEGWAAGLQLASLTLRRNREAETGPVSGRHRFIADYLREDVLDRLTSDVRAFLLQTSILERLSAGLCDAVTGQEGAQQMLEHLEREGLFLVPLDDQRAWFRYHHLFADFLGDELRRSHADTLVHLHRRAARWHLAQDLPEPAFQHAVAGRDIALVTQICDDYIVAKLESGEVRTVARWIAAIPEEWYASHPLLGLAQVTYLVFSGDMASCTRALDEVEQRLIHTRSADQPRQLAKVAVVRCAIACFQNDLEQAETFAGRALRELTDEDLSFRADIFHALGDTYRHHGRWEEARVSYLKALDIAHTPAFRLRSAHLFGSLADMELQRGRLREAEAYWNKALAAIQDRENWGRLPLPVIGWVYLRLGELYYERNALEQAWDHLTLGLERAELGGDRRSLLAGYLMAGRVQLTLGDVDAAAAYLERAHPMLEAAPLPDWTSRFERLQLELWLAQGRLRTAVEAVEVMAREGALASRPDKDTARLTIARVLTVRGDGACRERALALLAGALQEAETGEQVGIQIEALALQALARWQGGERAGAMTSLEHALRLGEPEGYVRLFADLGLPMARLLQEAHARGVMPEYTATLLAACGASLSPADDGALPEPLSPREQEVVKLIAAGLTNREIAETLSISAETVKKHSVSIYGKLGVGNRTEAAASARELGLLD